MLLTIRKKSFRMEPPGSEVMLNAAEAGVKDRTCAYGGTGVDGATGVAGVAYSACSVGCPFDCVGDA